LLDRPWLIAFALASGEQKGRPGQHSGLDYLARTPNQWRGVRFPRLHPLWRNLNPQHARARDKLLRLNATDLAGPKASPKHKLESVYHGAAVGTRFTHPTQ
jgi:hypothetical protein